MFGDKCRGGVCQGKAHYDEYVVIYYDIFINSDELQGLSEKYSVTLF